MYRNHIKTKKAKIKTLTTAIMKSEERKCEKQKKRKRNRERNIKAKRDSEN